MANFSSEIMQARKQEISLKFLGKKTEEKKPPVKPEFHAQWT